MSRDRVDCYGASTEDEGNTPTSRSRAAELTPQSRADPGPTVASIQDGLRGF
jgi:hypothetical protein